MFSQRKRRAQVRATAAAAPFAGAELEAYEIHTGVTEAEGEPFARYPDGGREGCVQGNVFGTYLHGLFDTGTLTEALAGWLCRRKGIDPSDAALIPMEEYRRQQFDKLADGVRAALDMDAVYAAMGIGNGEALKWSRDFCTSTGATERERPPPPWALRSVRWEPESGWSSSSS